MDPNETLLFELEEKASTAGPWKRDGNPHPYSQVIAIGNEVVVYHGRHNRQIDTHVVPNMDFIVHLRNHAPDIIRAKNARLEQAEKLAEAGKRVLNAIDELNPGGEEWNDVAKEPVYTFAAALAAFQAQGEEVGG